MAARARGGDDRTLARQLTAEIARLMKAYKKPVRLMEVCGTHTVAIFRAGLRQILPPEVALISGPGCPVCVTPDSYIDAALRYGAMPDVILTTFGDMLKVPGTAGSLSEAAARGADVRVVYSPLDSLPIAAEHPDKTVIFLAVGFETTAPAIAATVMSAKEQGLKNFFLLSETCPPRHEAPLGRSGDAGGRLPPPRSCGGGHGNGGVFVFAAGIRTAGRGGGV